MACWGEEASAGSEVDKGAGEAGKVGGGGSLRGGVAPEERGTSGGGEVELEEETGGLARNRGSCKGGVVRLEGVAWGRGGDPEKSVGEGGAVRVERGNLEGETRGLGKFCGEPGGEGRSCAGGAARGRGAGEKGEPERGS